MSKLFDSYILLVQVISILAVAFILQQCFVSDGHKVGEKNNQQWDHKHDPVNCDHSSHKHDHDHDHAGHSGHDHSGHKSGTSKTKTGPLRSSTPRSVSPKFSKERRSIPSEFQGSNMDVKDRHVDDIQHNDKHDHNATIMSIITSINNKPI